MIVKLRMSGSQHARLKRHLFPSDGKEAVVIALCGRRIGDNVHGLCIRKVQPVPLDQCLVRESDRVTWSTEFARPIFQEAAKHNWAIVKFHGHPNGLAGFSETDDRSDVELLSAAQVWTDSKLPHASAVMLPDGTLLGRWMTPTERLTPLDVISVAGDDLRFYFGGEAEETRVLEFAVRNAQAFGEGTTNMLRRLSVAVVGCSGTGSPVVELLARLGVGRLLLIDPDRMEARNLNRILHAILQDVYQKRFKVHVAADAVRAMGTGTIVECIAANLCNEEAVKRAAECDVLFGCTDGVEGRHLLNKIAAFYCLPYIDVGVRLDADGAGGIDQICGTVHYLQPGGSSLLSRGAITMEAVQAEGLKRLDPRTYATQLADKYIRGVQEDRPAVAPVNMHYGSLAVMELLARLHSFRVDGNGPFAQFGSSLTDPRFEPAKPDGVPCAVLAKHVGRGDTVPLLDNPYLGEADAA